MAYLAKKKIKGKNYNYLMESARINGKPLHTKQFALDLEELKQKYEAVFGINAEVTIVFDCGNNSQANITALDAFDGKLQYVGGLKKPMP